MISKLNLGTIAFAMILGAGGYYISKKLCENHDFDIADNMPLFDYEVRMPFINHNGNSKTTWNMAYYATNSKERNEIIKKARRALIDYSKADFINMPESIRETYLDGVNSIIDELCSTCCSITLNRHEQHLLKIYRDPARQDLANLINEDETLDLDEIEADDRTLDIYAKYAFKIIQSNIDKKIFPASDGFSIAMLAQLLMLASPSSCLYCLASIIARNGISCNPEWGILYNAYKMKLCLEENLNYADFDDKHFWADPIDKYFRVDELGNMFVADKGSFPDKRFDSETGWEIAEDEDFTPVAEVKPDDKAECELDDKFDDAEFEETAASNETDFDESEEKWSVFEEEGNSDDEDITENGVISVPEDEKPNQPEVKGTTYYRGNSHNKKHRR